MQQQGKFKYYLPNFWQNNLGISRMVIKILEKHSEMSSDMENFITDAIILAKVKHEG